MISFSIIAAVDEEWGIGKDGVIPWRYSEDFKWFKKMTMGNTCFMGYNTYSELATIMEGKKELLPGRKCVVFTSRSIDDPRVSICRDSNRYQEYTDTEENFFIGGTSVFDLGLDIADWVYITKIPGKHGCNVVFPHNKLLNRFNLGREISLSDELTVEVYEKNDKE